MDRKKEKLFNDNSKLVHYVIKQYFQGLQTFIAGYEYEDIVQVGNIGLWKACSTFNSNKNIYFSTYATHIIRNEILLAIRKNKKNTILNNSLSLNSILEDDEGNEMELENMLIYNYDSKFTISDIISYIHDKYKDSEIELNIINSYIFENMSQDKIGRKYGYSQATISRIIKRFRICLKNDFEKDGLL